MKQDSELSKTLKELLDLSKKGKLKFINIVGAADKEAEGKSSCFEFTNQSEKLELSTLLFMYAMMLKRVTMMKKAFKETVGKEPNDVEILKVHEEFISEMRAENNKNNLH